MPAKLKGKEARQVSSIRLEPAQKEKIIQVFGSLQSWIDLCIEILNNTKGAKYEKDKKEK